MKKKLIKPLNLEWPEKDTVKVIQKEDVFEVFCKYVGCSYSIKYTYSDVQGSLATKINS